jgi:endonuclease/exonuclease/phosphatase family metal-dependent hydrolase
MPPWCRLRSSVLVAVALALTSFAETAARAESTVERSQTAGELKLVTYNVAGLPEGISASHPSVNMPKIGKLLNDYDIALVQEDFAYPLELRSSIRHPYASAPFVRGTALDFGDGLSQFGRLPFERFTRNVWARCSGYLSDGCDCLTPKGFTFARYVLAEGTTVDVYNLHMDAGDSRADRAARALQLSQIAAAIMEYSVEKAVIVAGDTNASHAERGLLQRFMAETGLREVCDELGCMDPRRIDRVFFRNSRDLSLRPRSWSTDRRFVDAARRPLSDHLAVAVKFAWEARAARDRLATPQPSHVTRAGNLERRTRRFRAGKRDSLTLSQVGSEKLPR